jgi:hypothetical protein
VTNLPFGQLKKIEPLTSLDFLQLQAHLLNALAQNLEFEALGFGYPQVG